MAGRSDLWKSPWNLALAAHFCRLWPVGLRTRGYVAPGLWAASPGQSFVGALRAHRSFGLVFMEAIGPAIESSKKSVLIAKDAPVIYCAAQPFNVTRRTHAMPPRCLKGEA